MKCLLTIILSLFLLIFDSYSQSLPNSSATGKDSESTNCFQPITWKVGSIDSRFQLDPNGLKKIMKDVENLWGEAVNQTLIQYSDRGEVAINLIYSDRQKFTDDEQKLSDRINKMRKKYYTMRMDYQEESLEFQEKHNLYNQTFNEYADKVNEYNLHLSRLTNSGIVSRDEDEKLKNLKKEMEFLEKNLNPLEQELSDGEHKLNRMSKELNRYADGVNEYVFQYRNRYEQSRTFYQGFYNDVGDQKKINVYQFENVNKLRLVLAHEFGHALGLRHNENPVSIMNYNMRLQNNFKLKLSDQDIQSIQNECAASQASM